MPAILTGSSSGAAAAARRVHRPEGTMTDETRSWEDAQTFLRGRYGLARDESRWAGLELRFQDGDAEVVQPVQVEAVEVMGRAWLLLRAPVCPEARLRHRLALRHG